MNPEPKTPWQILFCWGYRPFYVGVCLYAALPMAVWLANLSGAIAFPTKMAPVAWHAHEMLFGFAAACMAAFTLTSLPIFVGHPAIADRKLQWLFGVWLAGRAAFLLVDYLPLWLVSLLDLAFLPFLAATVTRVLVWSGIYRNGVAVICVYLYAIANLVAHLGYWGVADVSSLRYFPIFVVALMIAVIGGRIVPTFEAKWRPGTPTLARMRGPLPEKPLDYIALAALLILAFAELLAPADGSTAVIAFLTAALHLVRWCRWKWESIRNPYQWGYSLGYLWLVISLWLLACSKVWDAMPHSTVFHSFTAGMLGTMLIAAMTRLTAGFSNLDSDTNWVGALPLISITASALIRIAGPMLDGAYADALMWSGFFWIAGYCGWFVLYGKRLWTVPHGGWWPPLIPPDAPAKA